MCRIRVILKALLQIGANLSQSREYRDLFEDLLTKVAEPLEDIGMHGKDMQVFLVCCMYAMKSIAFPNRGHRGAGSNVGLGPSLNASGGGISGTYSSFAGSGSSSGSGSIGINNSSVGHGERFRSESAASFGHSATSSSVSATTSSINAATLNNNSLVGANINPNIGVAPPHSPNGGSASYLPSTQSFFAVTQNSSEKTDRSVASNTVLPFNSTQGMAGVGVGVGVGAGTMSGVDEHGPGIDASSSNSASGSASGGGGSGIVSQPSNQSINLVHRNSSAVSLLATETGMTQNNRGDVLRKDWIRFLTCCRLCLQQLVK